MSLIYWNFSSTKAYGLNKKLFFFCIIQILFICRKNTYAVSDFRISPKSPQIENTFPFLYPALSICMFHSCGSRTWIIRFSPLFPICKPYLPDASLGGCQNRSLYLGAIRRQLFSRSIIDDWQGPKYASAYSQSILFFKSRQCNKAEDFALSTLSGIFSHSWWYQF